METLFHYLIVIVVVLAMVVAILAIATSRKSRKKSNGSSNGAATNGGNKLYSFTRNWWWIALMVIALTGFGLWFTDLGLWLIGFGLAWSPFSQSPSLQTASAFVQNYWLTIFSFYLVLALALFISLNANTELRGWSETTQRILIGVMLLLFVGLPIVSWMTRVESPRSERQAMLMTPERSREVCIETSPCAPTRLSGNDGPTEKVLIPVGTRVCFDEHFWDNLPRLGYTTSYMGGPEERYTCTKEDVQRGTCHEKVRDAFRFTPGKGVEPPQYWFDKRSDTMC